MTGEEMLDSLIATHPELWRRMREERAYRTAASDTMVEVVAAAPERRAPEVVSWVTDLAASPTLGLDPFETPSHPTHRRAAL